MNGECVEWVEMSVWSIGGPLWTLSWNFWFHKRPHQRRIFQCV